jgi:putative Mg2+ transporter-C (MgtC) family protein
MPTEWELILRLVMAAVLGAIIGAQREWTGKPAGMRTLALLSLGSALCAVISATAFPGGDPSRIAAAVITGIGFLGAGAILHRNLSVEGLTTAAAIWVAAGIGLAVGSGMYLIPVIVTILAVIILFIPHIKPRAQK